MTTLGKQWRLAQQQGKNEDAITEVEAERKKRFAEAYEIIKKIPALITAASNEKAVRVFGRVTHLDVDGTHDDKVDQLAERLATEKRPLGIADLDGRAAIVFIWCDANDLECFLVSEHSPLIDYEYDFWVRPKAG